MEPNTATIRFGISVHDQVLALPPDERRLLLRRIADAGMHHVNVSDHVSFRGGTGFDGMVSAAAALATEDRLQVIVGIYLAALRHPMTIARQLASLAEIGPGRLVFGVGAGGEDRAEVENCGVDPATRGRRLDETLDVLARLAGGGPVDHEGEFFQLTAAAIDPTPSPPIPIVIGGVSAAAARRAGRIGDGWLGVFCSPRKFGQTRAEVLRHAAEHGRTVGWFGLQQWCGLDADRGRARELLAPRMEALYGLPYERFARLAPAGTPADVAAHLVPFVEAGARHVTLVVAASEPHAAVDHAADVHERLLRLCPSS